MNQMLENEIDLFEFFETLWDGKWKIIATTLVAAVIGVFLIVVKPNSFESPHLFKAATNPFFSNTPP